MAKRQAASTAVNTVDIQSMIAAAVQSALAAIPAAAQPKAAAPETSKKTSNARFGDLIGSVNGLNVYCKKYTFTPTGSNESYPMVEISWVRPGSPRADKRIPLALKNWELILDSAALIKGALK